MGWGFDDFRPIIIFFLFFRNKTGEYETIVLSSDIPYQRQFTIFIVAQSMTGDIKTA
jgi:hypothetical protein